MDNVFSQIKTTELKGSTFRSRILDFGDFDISGAEFNIIFKKAGNILSFPNFTAEKIGNTLVIPYNILESYSGEIRMEAWIILNGVKDLALVDTMLISAENSLKSDATNHNVSVTFGDVVIPVTFTQAIVNIGGGTGSGENGKSAYEIAVLNGFPGTEPEWLIFLKGADGKNFTYEDFTPEQLALLKGDKGDPGESNFILVPSTPVLDFTQNNYANAEILTGAITLSEGTGSIFGKMAYRNYTGGLVNFPATWVKVGSNSYDATKINKIAFWVEYGEVSYTIDYIATGTQPEPDPEPTPTLAAPVITAGTPTQNSIPISWAAVTDATSYDVYNAITNTLIGNATGTTYTATGLTPSTAYSFYVKAKNATLTSVNSNTVSATTSAAPSEVTISTPKAGIINSAGEVSGTTGSHIEITGMLPNTLYRISGYGNNHFPAAGYYYKNGVKAGGTYDSINVGTNITSVDFTTKSFDFDMVKLTAKTNSGTDNTIATNITITKL